jgi:hypothetical protein
MSQSRRRRPRAPECPTNDAEAGRIGSHPVVLSPPPPPPWYRMVQPHVATLQSISLSRNEICTAEEVLYGLDQLPQLVQFDISYNRLTNLSHVNYQLGNNVILNVSYNHLTTVDGIDRLYSLQQLYLQHNQLTDVHATASRLANLPLLTELYLWGNPFESTTTTTISLQQQQVHIPEDDSTTTLIISIVRYGIPPPERIMYHSSITSMFGMPLLNVDYPCIIKLPHKNGM